MPLILTNSTLFAVTVEFMLLSNGSRVVTLPDVAVVVFKEVIWSLSGLLAVPTVNIAKTATSVESGPYSENTCLPGLNPASTKAIERSPVAFGKTSAG